LPFDYQGVKVCFPRRPACRGTSLGGRCRPPVSACSPTLSASQASADALLSRPSALSLIRSIKRQILVDQLSFSNLVC